MPCSMPLRAAWSAVTCAANGVDLREPLKPAPPADSHAITLPWVSVSDTIVLLNEVLMCAWPTGMFFFALGRPPARSGAAIRPQRAPPARTTSVAGTAARPPRAPTDRSLLAHFLLSRDP